MKQPTNQTAFLIVVAVFAIPLLLLMIGNALLSSSYPGDAIPFEPIASENDIDNTSYRLDYIERNLVLVNKFTGTRTVLVQGYSPVATPPTYALVWENFRIYLIIRMASGGNTGSNWYRVFKVSMSPFVDLLPDVSVPENGLSCIDPRLEDHDFPDRLLFVRSTNCADSAAPRQNYEIKLT